MKTYELTYIVSPLASVQETDSIQKEVESLIQAKEGVILKSDKTGAKTLSYNIQKQSSGYFVTSTFQVSEDKLKEIQHKLEHEHKILRHIIVIKRPVKEMKARLMRRFSFKPEMKKSVFETNMRERKKIESAPVKEEEINKKLDEILSE